MMSLLKLTESTPPLKATVIDLIFLLDASKDTKALSTKSIKDSGLVFLEVETGILLLGGFFELAIAK
jgi:hypothetical protein